MNAAQTSGAARTQAREATEQATDLLRAVLTLAADLDLRSLLERFVRASTEMTGARYGAINILDEHGASRTFVQSGISDSVVARLAHAPHAVGVLGQIPDEGVLLLGDLTEHPAHLGLPAGHPRMGPFLGTAVRVHGETYGYLYLAEKRTGFDEDDVAVVEALAAAAAVAIHNAELYAVERRRERWLTAAQQVTTMLLEGADQEDVLCAIAHAARSVDGAAAAVLVLPGVDGRLTMEIVDGARGEELLGLVVPPDGPARVAFETGQTHAATAAETGAHPLTALRVFGPALYVPFRTGDRSVGVMILLRDSRAEPYTAADVALSQTFAAQAALAIVLAEARAAADDAALLGERGRIARDLHDLALQQMFAAGMQLGTARREVADAELPRAARVTTMLDGALDHLDSSVRQVRAIVRTIQRADAQPAVVHRLRREVTQASALLGFIPACTITVDGRPVEDAQSEQSDVERVDAVMGATRADHVVAVVREGLTNAARHARCSAAWVRLSVVGSGVDGRVVVEVEDDGVGLPPVRERQSGTRNLAVRAGESGGEFVLGPREAGTGTLLRWSSPLD